MAETPDSIVDKRKELMASLSGDSTPIFRDAHFLKPSVTSIDEPFELISLSRSSLPSKFEPRKWPLKINLNGWRYPTEDWTKWVNSLHPKYQSTWKKAGIYEAIMNSTFLIWKDENLVLGISERWSPETNTFHFPWAEATITLEDVMVLGGYSVLGDSVFRPLETKQLKEIHEKLIHARTQTGKTKTGYARNSVWMKMFMESGSEIEHEAFLATWLSAFVLGNSRMVRKIVFPIAVHLSRGTQIALAPAVLAAIYKDLSSLKEAIVASSTGFDMGKNRTSLLELHLWSPFHLLHIWALERFRALQPLPNSIKRGEPFFARWHRVKRLKLGDVRLAIDSAGESFQWRPYTKGVVYWNGSKLYGEKSMWVPIGPGLDEKQESFALCLRVSKLVGIDCIEQYLPHRVAMQFGMDQDLPGCVVESNETPEVAWTNFSKPIGGTKLYIPSRYFEAGVSARYLDWKKKSFDFEDTIKEGNVKRQKSRRSSPEMVKTMHKASEEEYGNSNEDVPPGFPPKSKTANRAGKSIKVEPAFVEMMNSNNDGKNLGHSQSFSDSIADNRAAGEKKLVSESVERSRQSEGSMEGLKITRNDGNERNSGNLGYCRVSNYSSKIEGSNQENLAVEARISRIERVLTKFAGSKAWQE